jgi:predicted RNA-binding protein
MKINFILAQEHYNKPEFHRWKCYIQENYEQAFFTGTAA